MLIFEQSYSVKVKLMDKEHRQLFRILNQVDSILKQGKQKDNFKDIMIRLIDYSMQHFESEEAMMEKYHYPDLSKHRIEHHYFIHKLKQFNDKHIQSEVTLGVEIFRFLVDWIDHHIRIEDQKYGPFFNTKGLF